MVATKNPKKRAAKHTPVRATQHPSLGNGHAYGQDMRQLTMFLRGNGQLRLHPVQAARTARLFPSFRTTRRWMTRHNRDGHYRRYVRQGNIRATILRGRQSFHLAFYRMLYPKATAAEINAYLYGSHWAKMAKMIPGRTDNGIKNRFHNLRRQLEREDEHRLRLSEATDFPEEIRLDRLRELPDSLKGKGDELWDMGRGIGVLAAQSVLGGGITRNGGRFGPFRTPKNGELCARCGLLVPSLQCGKELCTETGWCQSCTRIPPHISGTLLRECLNLRRCDDKSYRAIIESWEELFAPEEATGGKDVKSE